MKCESSLHRLRSFGDFAILRLRLSDFQTLCSLWRRVPQVGKRFSSFFGSCGRQICPEKSGWNVETGGRRDPWESRVGIGWRQSEGLRSVDASLCGVSGIRTRSLGLAGTANIIQSVRSTSNSAWYRNIQNATIEPSKRAYTSVAHTTLKIRPRRSNRSRSAGNGLQKMRDDSPDSVQGAGPNTERRSARAPLSAPMRIRR